MKGWSVLRSEACSGRFDWHVHPDFSPDAEGTVREYCRSALQVGLKGLCFTTHYEPDPARADREFIRINGRMQPVASEWVQPYFEAVEQVRKDFPGLRILTGVEIGFEPGLERLVEEFLARYRFDFVLGSVHCIDHVAISSGSEQDEMVERFRDLTADGLMSAYFDRVVATVQSGFFDALGHLDIYRKYVIKRLGSDLLTAAERQLPRALEVIAHSPVALEINTSALRRGDDEPYPSEAILEAAVDAGVRRFTIGSDSHRPEDVGAGFSRARALLTRLGIDCKQTT